ncbi:MAG: 4-(cytidine 5'-diphospho)-2-C-methyl-D-erythritol kinase [Hormoscilla sp.]
MHSYSLEAAAKINLYLEIIGDRPDGYHELVTIFQSINLADRLKLRPSSTDSIRVHCDHPQVPSDRTNLAYRAAELMKREYPDAFAKYGGIDITIDKHIPVAAGLAGGSTNAAAVLVGIDLMWQLGLTQGELQTLAAQLGSDVPFCVMGGTALATGRGEKLSPLPDLDHLYVVLAKYRNLTISTPWAYQTYRQKFSDGYITDAESLAACWEKVHSGPMVKAIAHKDSTEIGKLLHNDFERVVFPEYPQLMQLKAAFEQAGVLGTIMSGSGPTMFALTETAAQGQLVKETVKQAISDPNLDLWVTKFTPTGMRMAQ